jgi:hypothetical protein
MRFTSTVIVGTHTRLQFIGTQQPVWFRYGPLAMDPFGFDRIEPGAFCGQPAGDNADALPRPLDVLILGAYPGYERPDFYARRRYPSPAAAPSRLAPPVGHCIPPERPW